MNVILKCKTCGNDASKTNLARFALLTLFLILPSACTTSTPSVQMIETAIAQTQSAIPSDTPTPSQTPTSTPTITPTIDPCPHELAVNFDNEIFTALKSYNDAMKLLTIDVDSAKMMAQSAMIEKKLNIMTTIEYPLCGKPVYDAALAYMDACFDWSNVLVSHGSKAANDAAFLKITNALLILGEATAKFRQDAKIVK